MNAALIPFRGAALLGAAALSLLPAPAAAQDSGRGTTVMAGVGAQAYPKFVGADDYGIFPYFIGSFRREGSPLNFSAPGDGLGITLLSRDNAFNFGPSVEFVAEREEDDVGAPVGNVGFTVEAGGFVELFPTQNFRLRAEVRKGIGGHEGLVSDLSADFVVRDRDTYVFSIGPRARWADDNYHDAYFGVTPAVAVASGLPAYNPSSGFYSVGAAAGLTYKLGRNWGMQGYLGYDRLVGDAADSPIVRNLGSRDQFSGGAGLFFEFTIR
ncbi:MAG: MipA/OmpV family protein [Alphaproteobacteria bacterium]|nr:MAG: MipA/OmpV family protein [Alphaproteobacteria bacterium]